MEPYTINLSWEFANEYMYWAFVVFWALVYMVGMTVIFQRIFSFMGKCFQSFVRIMQRPRSL